MEYWVIINDSQQGPLSLDEVMALGITPETPVWYSGLESWTVAADVPEIAAVLSGSADCVEIPPIPEIPPVPVVEEAAVQPVGQIQPAGDIPPCPATYLVWAILCTIFCCLPLGIPAIIYATQVSACYRKGDYDGARDRSEKAALWVIVSFVVGLVSMPLQIACSML